MALPSSGNSISFGQINDELGNSTSDTLDLETAAETGFGLSKPHGLNEMFGLSKSRLEIVVRYMKKNDGGGIEYVGWSDGDLDDCAGLDGSVEDNLMLIESENDFNEDGTVNWRKMVKEEFLVPNKQRTQETDVSKLEDYQLIILLGGIKELAQIRGYTNVRYEVTSPSSDYVVATCSIDWIPNYETEDRNVTFSAIGDASPSNTQSFAKFFLGPIAENRAFVRCVRNFLKINIDASALRIYQNCRRV